MARHQPSADRTVRRTFGTAALRGVGTARIERAAGRRVERRGELALEDDALTLLADIDALPVQQRFATVDMCGAVADQPLALAIAAIGILLFDARHPHDAAHPRLAAAHRRGRRRPS